MSKSKRKKSVGAALREGKAPPHQKLVDDRVHVFVDDQNLFWGIVNEELGRGYRMDFGRLLTAACMGSNGKPRFVKSAYIAGVIPDDDSFWKVAENQGFKVRRGYLGSSGGRQRSKQDDAYLITDMTATLYEEQGPSTVVLVAGDADYVLPLLKALEKGWRVEVVFINKGLSSALDPVTHEFRSINASNIQYFPPGR